PYDVAMPAPDRRIDADLEPRSDLSEAVRRLVKLAISAVVLAVDEAVGRVAPSRRRGRRSNGVVLMYHDVAAADLPRFAAQCDLFQRLGQVVPVDEMHGTPDGRWRIAITFDDAFPTFASVA